MSVAYGVPIDGVDGDFERFKIVCDQRFAHFQKQIESGRDIVCIAAPAELIALYQDIFLDADGQQRISFYLGPQMTKLPLRFLLYLEDKLQELRLFGDGADKLSTRKVDWAIRPRTPPRKTRTVRRTTVPSQSSSSKEEMSDSESPGPASDRVVVFHEKSVVSVKKCPIDVYAQREILWPEDEMMKTLTLDDFFRKYKVTKLSSEIPTLKVRNQERNLVVVYHPTINIRNHPEQLEEFMFFELMKYKHWKVDPRRTYLDSESTESHDVQIQRAYDELMSDPAVRAKLPRAVYQAVENAKMILDQDLYELDVEPEGDEDCIEEEWQLLIEGLKDSADASLAGVDIKYNDPQVDWAVNYAKYGQDKVDEWDESWISSRKNERNPEWERKPENADPAKLNKRQRLAYEK